MKILIDNGHGLETLNNRSPDGVFFEYKYTRLIASRVVSALVDDGYDADLLVAEETDIPLSERVRRVNAECGLIGSQNVVLVSIHVNASSNDGKWHDTTGWCAYTAPGITTSDLLAYHLYEAARKNLTGKVIRLCNGPHNPIFPAFKGNFHILSDTLCPSVLTENFYWDNTDDVRFLQSRMGMEAITTLHFEGTRSFLLRF